MAKVAMQSTWAEDRKGALVASGVCSLGAREAWSMGRWRLDDYTLQFAAASTRGNVNLPLENIRRIETVQRKFLVVSKPCLLVRYRPRNSSSLSRLWLLTGDLAAWELRIGGGIAVPLGGGVPDRMQRAFALTEALRRLNGPTAQILDLMSGGGPATSATVSGVLNLDENDSLIQSATLAMGFAEVDAVLGVPTLRYERSRFDPATGVVHSMCWWLNAEVGAMWTSLREPVEVYVEADTVVIVTTAPTKSTHYPPSAEVDATGRGVLIRGDEGYSRYLTLPTAVYDDLTVEIRTNGTLVVVGRLRDEQLQDELL
ncbi:MAG: hypothetical protein WCP95_13725 [Actinomycetes bacterium]